jgi:hypothetical protein
MRRVYFSKLNHSDNVLHIETEGCIVNIHVNLHDATGRGVTAVEILRDWNAEFLDSPNSNGMNVRVGLPTPPE